MSDNGNSGRSVEIDTGFYRVEVSGPEDDCFETLMENAMQACDRAKADAVELDDRIEDSTKHYQ